MVVTHGFTITPLEATFGAVVTGRRLAEIDEAAFAWLYTAWLDRALLIFPGQHLTREEQVAFARRFGPPEFEIAPLSNVRPDGSVRAAAEGDEVVKTLLGNMGWHHDSTYMPVQAKGAVFSAHVVPPEGGETEWADMRAAYDALDPALRAEIEPLRAFHSLRYSQSRAGFSPARGVTPYGFDVDQPPLRPLVKTHPETGRRNLVIGRHAFGIPGLTPERSQRLLDDLCDFACQPPRVHRHSWTPGEVVVWDNRRLMHRACPWDMTQPRVMYHSRVAGDPVTEFAAGVEGVAHPA
ncbi:MAG TPA: TauD/TfdA family dioxygenase [Caulobacteraceae bacterium]|nr:TauD/TfdA family dioxygenase [Caulobacteraceae bacterium]